jgi:hypothetical protein
MGNMNESLLGADAPALALQQPVPDGESERRPQDDGTRQGQDETTEVEAHLPRPLHRGAGVLAVLSVGAVQVAWVAVLAYAAYWLVTHFPS